MFTHYINNVYTLYKASSFIESLDNDSTILENAK